MQQTKFLALNLPGVYREREYRRYYPGKQLASNVIGFVGQEQDKALAGIERHYNSLLLHASKKSNEKGHSLQLSIDSFFQNRLEREVGKVFYSLKSKRAVCDLDGCELRSYFGSCKFPQL